tara:strand:- start:803 stop:982 length:180 start_codon:yes stop_codon:yes gene_type:complete
MSDDNRKRSSLKNSERQLNVAIEESLLDRFHNTVELKGHKKKAVVNKLLRLYVEGKVTL